MARTLEYSRSRDDAISGYLYISSFFIVFAVFGVFPLFYTAVVSGFRWDILGTREFVGFRNYSLLLEDPRFWQSVFNTLSIWFLTTIPQQLLALIIAVMLNQSFVKYRAAFRLGVFLPNVTSTVAVALVFGVIFARRYGIVNQMLDAIGWDPINWQGTVFGTHAAIATMVNWRWLGYGVVIFLAGLQSIPSELYESASIDGASAVRKFFSITIPSIRSIFIFKLIVSTIGGFQLFVEPLLFSGVGGGSNRQGLTMTLYLYEEGFRRFNFGYASTIAWALFIIVLVFSLLNFAVTRRIRSA